MHTQGHICPREFRQVRDLLRKRLQLIQLRTLNILSIQNLIARNTGENTSGKVVKKLTDEAAYQLLT